MESLFVVLLSKQPAEHFLRQLKELEMNLPWDQTGFQSIVPDLPVKGFSRSNGKKRY